MTYNTTRQDYVFMGLYCAGFDGRLGDVCDSNLLIKIYSSAPRAGILLTTLVTY
jgi:hypothetical protein